MKTCSKCKQEKSETDFNKHKQKKDGLNSWCRDCTKLESKIHSEKNKENKAEYDRNYRLKNLEKLKKYSKEYSIINKELKSQYDHDYRLKLGEYRLANKRDYYHNRGGKEIVKKWQLNNANKLKSNNHNTGAKRRLKLKESTLSGSDIFEWVNSQPKICTYCSEVCHDNYQIDHIEPLALHGEHELSNLTIACTKCNQSKRATTLLVWFAKQTYDRINRS